VYFIGAGFSAGLGYPLGNGLIRCLNKHLRRMGARNGSEAERVAAEILDFERTYVQADSSQYFGNVVEFFTLAQMHAEDPYDFLFTGKNDGSTFFETLAALTRTCFTRICQNNQGPGGIPKRILDTVVSSAHAVVSFNWDEEVDWYFTWKNDESDPVYTRKGWSGPNEYLLLKPHGSVGWYDIGQGLRNQNLYFIVSDADERIRHNKRRLISYEAFRLPLTHGSVNPHTLTCPPVISAPTFAKQFKYEEQRLIWSDVIEVCKQANEFVFLGYSLPTDDYFTRAALRKSLNERKPDSVRCLIVNRDVTRPNPKARNFVQRLTSYEQLMQNYTSVFGPLEARNFLKCDFSDDDESFEEKLKDAISKAVIA